MNLVQFSHGILAVDGNVSVHVTPAQAEVNPHPDDLFNPLGMSIKHEADALMRDQAEVAACLEAEEEKKKQDEAAKAAADAAEAEAKQKADEAANLEVIAKAAADAEAARVADEAAKAAAEEAAKAPAKTKK